MYTGQSRAHFLKLHCFCNIICANLLYVFIDKNEGFNHDN